MSKMLRIALAWLLAVALPLQGYAAQAMLTCGPAHHQQTVAMHEPAMQGDHAATDAHHGHEAHEAAKSGKADKAGTAGKAGKCSACASCCGAAAMSTATVSIEVIPPVHAPVVATIPAGKAIESVGGLDRPPRPFLA